MNKNNTDKKSKSGFLASPLKIILAGLIVACLFTAAGSAVTPASLTVTDFTIYPQTLMPGDSGIASITLKNTGSTFAPINKAMIKESVGIVDTQTDYYNNLGGVSAGDSITITLPIKAGETAGTYYPVFYIDFNDGISYLKYPFAVIIDDKGLDISLKNVPESFGSTTTEPVTLTLGNHLRNNLESVSVTAEGKGVSCKEGNVYVGTISAGTSQDVTLTVKTEDASEVRFAVTYSNGANTHTEFVTVSAGESKSLTSPELIVTNIIIKKTDGYYTLNADINNAGFSTANSLRITTEESSDVGPYSVYVVGSLDDDDLAGFELTFDAPSNDVITLVVSYKNDSGELITENIKVNVSKHLAKEESSSAPIVIGIIVVVVVIAGIVYFVSRNKKGKNTERR